MSHQGTRPPRTRRARVAVLALTSGAFLAGGLAGCGVPTSGGPTLIADDDVPFGLLSSTSTTSTTAPPEDPTFPMNVCLYRGEALVTIPRQSPVVNVPAALDALRGGPTRTEQRDGLASAIFDTDVLVSGQRTGGVAHVELGATFTEVGPSDQLRMIAQTVCTLTGLPGVGQVAFQLAGSPIDIPRGDGSLTSSPVSRDDYAQLLAAPR